MYYIKGYNESINAIVSAMNEIPDRHPFSDRLRSSYLHFLKNESVIENYNDTNTIMLTDFNGLWPISSGFCKGKEKYFANNSQILADRLRNGFFQKALDEFNKSSPEIFNIASFVIKIIVLNHLHIHTNGTTADMLGLACMDFKDHFDERDFIELVMHQMVHMLLFLDNHTNPHMVHNTESLMIETGLKFILGGTKFPAYIAFHSYIVGVEILHFRSNHEGLGYAGKYHGSTDRIFSVCEKFKKCMIINSNLFTPRGRSFLDDSFILLDNLKNSYHKPSELTHENN